MKKYLSNPYVHLAARALIAAVSVVVSSYVSGNGDVRALVVAGFVAFAEVFTPLNPFVGLFKGLLKPKAAPPPAAA